MDRELLKNLVEASYTHNKLDSKAVSNIVSRLNRKQLKAYIRGLKNKEKKMTIYIDSAVKLSRKTTEAIAQQFGKQQVRVTVDPKLLFGMRLQNGDDLYRLNVHDQLEDLKHYIAG